MLTEIGFSRQVFELQFLNQYFYISFYFYTFFVRTFSWFWNKNDKLLAFSHFYCFFFKVISNNYCINQVQESYKYNRQHQV